MKSELDRVLDRLPRASTYREGLGKGAPAFVYIDDCGCLCIGGEFGVLVLDEKNLAYLKADGYLL